jgi:hypothetical protein
MQTQQPELLGITLAHRAMLTDVGRLAATVADIGDGVGTVQIVQEHRDGLVGRGPGDHVGDGMRCPERTLGIAGCGLALV